MHIHQVVNRQSCIFFRNQEEADRLENDLRRAAWAVLKVDGQDLTSMREAYKSFAAVMEMPPNWYGAETYAPNSDAFLEYLDDVQEWIPAKGHLYVVENAASLFAKEPSVAGRLIELIQYSRLDRGEGRNSDARLLFVVEDSNA